MKRVYELIPNSAANTVYSTVVVLCGDLYEINRKSTGEKYVVPNAKGGTYENYSYPQTC